MVIQNKNHYYSHTFSQFTFELEMAFIKTRKKFVSSAIVSSHSMMAGNAIAQDQVAQKDTIRTQAATEQSLKVDQSANTKFIAPL